MSEISSESQFFSGNIANMISESPLNKMVPLTEDHGGGGGGCTGSSWTNSGPDMGGLTHRRYTSEDTPGIRCMRVVERGVSCIH